MEIIYVRFPAAPRGTFRGPEATVASPDPALVQQSHRLGRVHLGESGLRPRGSSRCRGRERLSSPPRIQVYNSRLLGRLRRAGSSDQRTQDRGNRAWGPGEACTHRAHRSPRRFPERQPEGVQARIRCENIMNLWNCSFWIYPDQNEVTAKSTCLKASVPEGSVMGTASGGGCPGAFPAAPEVWAPPLHPLAPWHRPCTACVA